MKRRTKHADKRTHISFYILKGFEKYNSNYFYFPKNRKQRKRLQRIEREFIRDLKPSEEQ